MDIQQQQQQQQQQMSLESANNTDTNSFYSANSFENTSSPNQQQQQQQIHSTPHFDPQQQSLSLSNNTSNNSTPLQQHIYQNDVLSTSNNAMLSQQSEMTHMTLSSPTNHISPITPQSIEQAFNNTGSNNQTPLSMTNSPASINVLAMVRVSYFLV